MKKIIALAAGLSLCCYGVVFGFGFGGGGSKVYNNLTLTGSAMKVKGTYSALANYSTANIVSYNGNSYIAKTASTGQTPGENTYWSLFASKGDAGASGSNGADGAQGPPGTVGSASGIDIPQSINPQYIDMLEGSANGTNKIRLTIPSSISADHTWTLTETGLLLDGATWGGGGAVASVFGRTGTVTAQPGDYTVAQITGAASTTYVDSAISGVSVGSIPHVSSGDPATAGAWNYNTTDNKLRTRKSNGDVFVTAALTLETAADTTPAAFSFTDVTDATLSTLYTSNAITVTGINWPATISVTGGEYEKNTSGSWASVAGTVVNNDTVRVRHTSSASNSTATNTTLTIGGVSDTYTTTTVAGVGYLDEEKFEGTGAPSGWTTGGTVNYDYTTTVLEGAQSCFIASSSYSNYIMKGFTASDTVYIAFKLRPLGVSPGGNTVFFEFLNGSTVLAEGFVTDSALKPGVKIGGNSSAGNSTLTMGVNLTRYLKYRYTKGTGSNAVMTVWISTDGVTWEQSATVLNGTSTLQADKFDIFSNPSSDYIVDDVRISNSDINW